jgi:predicted DNA-binding antitoxin AbrB/MazE fold protein
MSQHVTAIYEHGVLRPLGPIDLREQDVVSLSINAVGGNGDSPATEPTLFEILDEAGLVGCIKNAPADLSTNPTHLEGFGQSGR